MTILMATLLTAAAMVFAANDTSRHGHFIQARTDAGSAQSITHPYTKRMPVDVGMADSPARQSAANGNESAAPTLCGIVINDPSAYYVASFPAQAGAQLTNIYSHPNLDASGQAIYVDGLLYVQAIYYDVMGLSTVTQSVFDVKTWELVEVREGLYQYSAAVSMAYDRTTGTVYGYFMDDSGSAGQMFTFGTMSFVSGETTPIISLYEDELVMAMAAAPDGRLYGVKTSGMFVEIDKNTGAQTDIGHTDIHPNYLQSATIDPQTGKFYWASIDDASASVLYEVDVTTGHATQITTFPNGEEIVGLYMMPGEAEAGAPAPATGLGFDFVDDNLSGNIVFTMPAESVDGMVLSGTLTALATFNEKTYTCEGTPGGQCSIPVEVSSDGMQLLTVVVSNEAGSSDAVRAEKWIGADHPMPVENLTLTKEGSKAILTWDAPTEGSHGGYINPDALTYEITQHGGGRYYEEGYIDTRLELDFTGEVVTDLEYSVRANYKGHYGDAVFSNSISFTQSSYDVPFTLDFGSDFGLCTVIDANEDGNTWTMTWSGLVIETPRAGELDDWLILPAINLETGNMYEISITAEAKMGPLSPEVFEVRMGQEPTIEGLGTLLSTQTIKSYKVTEDRRDTLSVEADGEYYFAIRAISDSGDELTLGEFSINLLASLDAPRQATAVNAIAAEGGALAATIEFTMPTLTENDAEISGVLSAEISRDGTVLTTLDNLAAGETYTYTDNAAVQGINEYSVVVIDGNGTRSVPAVCTVRCGIDIPSLPEDVQLVDEGGKVRLTWKHPETGINGGYVDPEGLTYTVYEPTYMMPLADGIQGTEFVYEYGELTGQSMLAFALGVQNLAGVNPQAILSNSVVLGDPFTLPFEETFATGSSNPWFLVGECWIDDDGWAGQSDAGVGGTGGYTYFFGSGEDGEEQSLVSAKITLKGAANPLLHFYCTSPDSSADTLRIEISTDFNGIYEVLQVINFADYTPSEWQEMSISLKDYIDAEYVHIAFHALPSRDKMFSTICVDEITIRDAQPYDLEALSLAMDKEDVKVGEKATATVSLRNIGTEAVAGGAYTVSLFANDRCVNTVEGIAIEPYAQGKVTIDFEPQVSDSAIVAMRATVEYANDVNSLNNTVEGGEMWIYKPIRPAVTDLTGSADVNSGTMYLSWSSPDLNGDPVMTRTDDFESYRPFSINSAGLWTIYDEDGQLINTPYYFPGWDKAVGFMVLNPGLVERLGGATLADTWPAHSGEQFMACFSPMYGDNDDWLITPELSGNAQTISFFARGGRESLGRESMEIYVSSTGNDIASMTLLTAEPVMVDAGVWTEYAFEVPKGTRYLGIRCTSHARESLQIDDVTYESAARPLDVTFVGYNVYCDGNLMNEEPLTETAYTGKLADGRNYTVRVVYDLGESDDSNVVVIEQGGTNSLHTGKKVVATEYYDLMGRRLAKAPVNTFVIVKYVYDDGSVSAEKKVLKECEK